MKDNGYVQGSVLQAQPVVFGKTMVYVHTDITELPHEEGGEASSPLFQYHEVQYTREEYARLAFERGETAERQMSTVLEGDSSPSTGLAVLQLRRLLELVVSSLPANAPILMEVADMCEAWKPGKTYPAGTILRYGTNEYGETQLYTVIKSHTSEKAPDKAKRLYRKLGYADDGTPLWTQPLADADAYDEGDVVSHAGKRWRSAEGTNTSEPGVNGWEEVSNG